MKSQNYMRAANFSKVDGVNSLVGLFYKTLRSEKGYEFVQSITHDTFRTMLISFSPDAVLLNPRSIERRLRYEANKDWKRVIAQIRALQALTIADLSRK